jgi:hypothetical protein
VGSHDTRAFDVTAVCPVTGHAVSISVRALKSPNAFLIDPEKVLLDATYVFVITGSAGQQPKFHVIRGVDLPADEKRFFGNYGRNSAGYFSGGVFRRRSISSMSSSTEESPRNGCQTGISVCGRC